MIDLYTLGATRIDVGENRLYSTATLRFALLLYLSVESGKPVPRVALTDLLLPDQAELKANHSLRELLYQLRQIGVEFVSTPEGLSLPEHAHRSDVGELLRVASLNVEQVEAATADFLPGYAPQLSEAFAEWLEAYRERTTSELRAVVVRELRRARSAGEWGVIGRMARACLRLDPYNEDATFAMAEVTALDGAKTGALALLDRYIAVVGPRRHGLELPAMMLKRRIAEQLPQRYDTRTVMPFVGRDAEMAELATQFARALRGDASCVMLLGEAGIGKTRLANEFVARAALDGARFATATAQPHDVHRPMGAFVDLVPQLLALPGALGCSPASMTALKRLTTHDPLASADPLKSVGQSDEVAAAISRAIADLVDAIASESVLVIWLEDAHWLDDMSLQMARQLAASRTNRRVLVLLTSRDEREEATTCGGSSTTILVKRLPDSSSRTLIDGALGNGASNSNDAHRKWVVETAAGNPFFLACIISHIERTGERFAIPSTITDLLDQRVATLSSEAMSSLEICVFLGKYATIERIVAAIELPHFQLLGVLKELEKRGMIVQRADRIQPSHWLVADSVQRKCAPIAAQFAHRCIAELFEKEAGERQSPAMLWDCGEHWLASGDVSRAVPVLRACSKHSVEIGRPREAAELLQRAALIADEELCIELAKESVRLAVALSERDLVKRGIEILRHAGVARAHDDIECAEMMANSATGTESEAILSIFRRCLTDPESTPEHRAQMSIPLIAYCAYQQDEEFAQVAFDTLTPLLANGGFAMSYDSQCFFLIYHATFGDRSESVRIARELMARTDLPAEQRADAYRKAGHAFWRSGHTSEALAAIDAGFVLSDRYGLRRLAFLLALTSASFRTDTGDAEGAQEWLSTAEAIAHESPELRRNLAYLILRTDIASATCNIGELRELYAAGKQIGIPDTDGRVCRWANTLRILIDHLSGITLNPLDAIAELTRYHRPEDSGDAADFEMATALRISRDFESRSVTRRRLRTYVNRIRLQDPPMSSMLQQIADQIEPGVVAISRN